MISVELRKSIVGRLVKPIATIISGKPCYHAKYKTGHFYFAEIRTFLFRSNTIMSLNQLKRR